MSTDLTMSFTVEQTPEQVFDAVNDVRSWWGASIVGDTTTQGAEWVYTVPDLHFSKFRTTELSRDERVEWLVLDSYLSFIEDKQEWTGTTVRFDISQDGAPDGRTRLTFTHLGLNPAHECFDVCDTAWSQVRPRQSQGPHPVGLRAAGLVQQPGVARRCPRRDGRAAPGRLSRHRLVVECAGSARHLLHTRLSGGCPSSTAAS